MSKTILVLCNRNARSGTVEHSGLEALFARHGLTAKVLISGSADESRAFVERNADAADAIVIGGGDGTIRTLLPDVLRLEVPLGILPLGTANDFARSIGIAENIEEAARTIAAGHRRKVDVAVADGAPFLNVVNIGLGQEVAKAHATGLKAALGYLAYPLHWWQAIRSSRRFRARLALDGNDPVGVRAEQISVSNSTSFGRQFSIDRTNSPDSGYLSVAILAPTGIGAWLGILKGLFTGRVVEARDASVVRARSVRIETSRPRAYSADGDIAGKTPVEIAIRHKALKVFVPRSPVAGGASDDDV